MPISLGLSTSVALRRRHGSPQVSHMCFAPYLPDLRASLPEQLWVNRSLPTLPRYTPHIRFLFVRLVLCYRLPPSRSLPPPTCRVASPSPVRADSGLSPHRHTCAAGRTKTKPRLPWKPGFCNCEPDDVLLSLEIQPTIIGDKAFHCPVRNGKEWYRLSMVIRQWLLSAFANDFDDFIIKPSVCRRHKSQSYRTMLGVSFWLH